MKNPQLKKAKYHPHSLTFDLLYFTNSLLKLITKTAVCLPPAYYCRIYSCSVHISAAVR